MKNKGKPCLGAGGTSTSAVLDAVLVIYYMSSLDYC
jgi:hypothetical protein